MLSFPRRRESSRYARKFLCSRLELENDKGEYFIYHHVYSIFLCFLCLVSLDSRLRGNDRSREVKCVLYC